MWINKRLKYLSDINFCEQAPPSALGFSWQGRWILSLSETLVLAAFSSQTDGWMTLIQHHPIEALCITATWILLIRTALTAWQLRRISFVYLDISNWVVGLWRKDDSEIRLTVYKTQLTTIHLLAQT